MDSIEKQIKDDISRADHSADLDIDSIIAGTHSRIKSRATRRKVLYSSPAVLIVLVMMYFVMPQSANDYAGPGGELFIAGWENSWTVTELAYEDNAADEIIFEQTIDYLIDEQTYSYIDDADALLDEADLEAFIGYLKEA